MEKKKKVLELTRFIGNRYKYNYNRFFALPRLFKYVNKDIFHAKRLFFRRFTNYLSFFFQVYHVNYFVNSFLNHINNYFLIFPYYIYEKAVIIKEEEFENQLLEFQNFLNFKFNKKEFFRKTKKFKNPIPFSGNYIYLYKPINQYKPSNIEKLCNVEDFDKKYFDKTALLRGYAVLERNPEFQITSFNFFF